MTIISLLTPINYVRPASRSEQALSTLSNYFYLGGARATVIKGNEARLENGKVSWKMIALKIVSYVILFPITLTLLAVDAALRSRYHFTVISSSKSPNQKPVPVTQEKESPPLSPSKATITAQPIEEVRQEIIPHTSPNEVFHPFTVDISDKHFPSTGSEIVSKEEMRLKAQEIGQLVLDKHIKLSIRIPSLNISSPSYEELERTQALKFIEELKSVGDVIITQWSDSFYIVPKKTEEVQKNLTIRKYDNGVIEEVQSSRESEGMDWTYWEGRRIYPDGVVETGRFNDFCWRIGTRVEKETTTYRHPKILIQSFYNRDLIWADIEGEKQLIVVKKKQDFGYSSDYVQTKEELIPTLTEILKKPNYACKKSLQEMLSGPINCEEFITYLFQTNSIFSLADHSLQILLEIIKEKGLIVNLHQKHPETGQTLFDRYSGSAGILQHLLDMDPTLIQRTEDSDSETAFVCALLSRNRRGATVLCNAMESQKIPLLSRELLFKKIVFSEGEVTLEELKSLSREDQQIAYQLANIYSLLDVVRTMRALGFNRSEELLMQEGPSIFECNMDVLEMHERLQAFLKNLRSQKLLLTQAEFDQLSKENYICKGSDIGRILGRNYIEKKARELGLKHVKAPRKMIVIDDNPNIELRTNADLEINAPKGGITIYAEKIQESNRKITAEEVSELLRLFEATGFCDIHWGNVIVAEDGVYIIDTEFTNFWVQSFYFEKGRQYVEMVKIVHALPIEQQQTLIDALKRKAETYQQDEEELNKQRKLRLEAEEAALWKSGCIYGPAFTFPVNELIA